MKKLLALLVLLFISKENKSVYGFNNIVSKLSLQKADHKEINRINRLKRTSSPLCDDKKNINNESFHSSGVKNDNNENTVSSFAKEVKKKTVKRKGIKKYSLLLALSLVTGLFLGKIKGVSFNSKNTFISLKQDVSELIKNFFAVKPLPQSPQNQQHAIGLREFGLGFGMIGVTSSILGYVFGLRDIANKVLVASSRMSLQLFFVGTVVLNFIFSLTADNSNAKYILMLYIVTIGTIASQESIMRVKYRYDNMKRDANLSIFAGVGATILFTTLNLVSFSSPASSSWDAQVIVPISGILLGNSISKIALVLSFLLSEFHENGRDTIELRLARGASYWESAFPIVREAMASAMLPTLNAMASTGIVHMPGTMIGSILAGRSPRDAAFYQIIVYFSICSAGVYSGLIMTMLVIRRMFDTKHHRLYTDEESTLQLKKQEQEKLMLENGTNAKTSTSSTLEILKKKNKFTENESDSIPILEVNDLIVNRSKLKVSFQLLQNDIMGIFGKSGIGKSQLLRTISHLEPFGNDSSGNNNNNMILHGIDNKAGGKDNYWRSQVIWVSQERPALPGSPRDFYDEVKQYQSFKLPSRDSFPDPSDLLKQWTSDSSFFDRPWKQLSGGEAQRAHLAIAIALNPSVLLLDEPTSQTDGETTLKIENTLRSLQIPIVIVSHSKAQIDRLCTKVLRLNFDKK